MRIQGVTATLTDNLHRVGDLVSSKREFIVKQIINVVLIIIILFIFGCLDFATLQFHYEYITNPNFWGNVATKTVADICSFNLGINFILDETIKRDTVLIEAKELYEKLNRYKDRDFYTFVTTIYNVKLKKAAYIGSINRKIYLLNKFAKRRDKIRYSYSVDGNEYDPRKGSLRNKYCQKRLELETIKSEDFIDKNLDSLNVKYKDVDPSVFELEIDGNQKVVAAKVTGSVTVGRVRASINVILGIILLTMFISSFSLTVDQQEFETQAIAAAHYCLAAFSDIGVVIWQILNGFLKTKGIVSAQLTQPYVERVKILKEYYAWRQENGKPVPQCFLELTKEKEEDEFVELSESEYKELKEKDLK